MASLVNKARDVTDKMKDSVYTAPQDATSQAQGGAAAAQFPRQFGGKSTRRDDLMRMKMESMDAQGMTPFGQVEATDADFKWIAKKQEEVEKANYDSWFGSNFHKNDLASRQFAQEINPEYYSVREKQMTERAKMALRIRLIEMRGPQSEEDLQLLFLLNTGRIQLGDNWDRIGPVMTNDAQVGTTKPNFKKGLFSLPRFLNLSQRKANAGVNPMGDRDLGGAPFGVDYNQGNRFARGGNYPQFQSWLTQ